MMLPSTQFAQIASGLTLEYRRQGPADRQPLIFLHGFTDSCRSFGPLLAALPDDIHAIAISLRGHGQSDQPKCPYDSISMSQDVAGLLDYHGHEQATVVGHCVGGFIAQRFALDFPDRTDRLILIDSFPTMVGNVKVAALLADLDSFAGGKVDPAFVRAFQESGVARPVPSDFMDMFVAESLRLPGSAWHKILSGIAAEDPSDLLPQITAPTLLICGEEDALFGVDYQHRLMAALPNAWLEILPGLGHSPHWEDPARIAAMITAFAGFAPASAIGAQE